MGLFIIVLMSVATVLLIRNMNKRLRRLPDSFMDGAAPGREAETARPDADLARSDAAAGVRGSAAGESDVDGRADGDGVGGVRAEGDDLGRDERAQ
ncbi:hypothetical protein [Pseudosporangium ferrugineum]|uniref:hypothetical protein n=1 Tax=Pseudosporangium ferrugineum TaxID=439699 RepID=UPI001FE7C4DD|nr:hypothetical protein [Pseudosporangium ferrugineum]